MKSLLVVLSVFVLSVLGIHAEEYPVDTCIVSGMKLGSMGDPYAHEHEGRTVYFCCAGCVGQFEANAEEMIEKLDRTIVAHQKKTYPLDVCVVSGEPLDEWGDPVDLVHDNRLVRFCCTGCRDDFLENPEPFLAKLDDGTPPEPPAEPHDHHHHGEHDHEHHHHHHH